MLPGEKAGWARPMRDTLHYRAPPAEAEPRKAAASDEIDTFATMQKRMSLWPPIREILRPSQDSINNFRGLCWKEAKLRLCVSPVYNRSCVGIHGRSKIQRANQLRELNRIGSADTRPEPASSTQLSLAGTPRDTSLPGKLPGRGIISDASELS